MADFADMASDLSEEHLEAALAAQREKARIERSRMPFMGICYNCDSKIGDHAHFCDVYCRNDWTLREWQKSQKFDPKNFMMDDTDGDESDED